MREYLLKLFKYSSYKKKMKYLHSSKNTHLKTLFIKKKNMTGSIHIFYLKLKVISVSKSKSEIMAVILVSMKVFLQESVAFFFSVFSLFHSFEMIFNLCRFYLTCKVEIYFFNSNLKLKHV